MMFAGCVLDFDAYDPRLGDPSDAGDAGTGGEGGSVETAGSGQGAGAQGGGAQGGGAQGGGNAQCAGADDGTPCGSQVDTECDLPNTCAQGICEDNLVPQGQLCVSCGDDLCKGCESGTCESCSFLTRDELETVYAQDGQADGLMFNVLALKPLRITGLDLNLATGFSGTIEIYTRLGGHIGQEGSPGAWTLLHTSTVTSSGENQPSTLSLDSDAIALGQNQTLGLYVTTTTTAGTNMLYRTEGSAAGRSGRHQRRPLDQVRRAIAVSVQPANGRQALERRRPVRALRLGRAWRDRHITACGKAIGSGIKASAS